MTTSWSIFIDVQIGCNLIVDSSQGQQREIIETLNEMQLIFNCHLMYTACCNWEISTTSLRLFFFSLLPPPHSIFITIIVIDIKPALPPLQLQAISLMIPSQLQLNFDCVSFNFKASEVLSWVTIQISKQIMIMTHSTVILFYLHAWENRTTYWVFFITQIVSLDIIKL